MKLSHGVKATSTIAYRKQLYWENAKLKPMVMEVLVINYILITGLYQWSAKY